MCSICGSIDIIGDGIKSSNVSNLFTSIGSPRHWRKRRRNERVMQRFMLYRYRSTKPRQRLESTDIHKLHWALVAFFERVNKFMLFEIGWEESETDSKKVQRQLSMCNRDSSYQFMTTSPKYKCWKVHLCKYICTAYKGKSSTKYMRLLINVCAFFTV